MKILIVSSLGIQGGAGIAAYRHHNALRSIGIDSMLFVPHKTTDDNSVISFENKIVEKFEYIRPSLDAIPWRMYKKRQQGLFSSSWLPFSQVVNQINKINPDIVHLHWICSGLLRVEDLLKIKAPIVWTLHDMWPFTGGCHYSGDCKKYLKNCNKCKLLGSSKTNDLSFKVFKRKSYTYPKIHCLTIVGLSKWLSDCAKQSYLFHKNQVKTLTNCINTNIFKPIEQTLARNVFDLPNDKKIISFGACSPTSDPRKGFKELSAVFEGGYLDKNNVELVIFGSNGNNGNEMFGYKTRYVGFLSDDISLNLLYNASDVIVVPSLQENLSNVIMESLSCGTPVVAFNIGGNTDMIQHKVNGYLSEEVSGKGLAEGIAWILNNPKIKKLGVDARKKVMNVFGYSKVANDYYKIYQEILLKIKSGI